MVKSSSKSVKQQKLEKSEAVMKGVALWTGFYRENPTHFLTDYLNINCLKPFQKILMYEFFHDTHVMYEAARGQGKSWILALFCVARCILYPGTVICITAFRKQQSLEIIQKIEMDFLHNYGWGSANLKNEIHNINTGVNNPQVEFKNGSWIKCVVFSDSARHNRANIVLIDEFRLTDPKIINLVIKKFLTAERHPGYKNNPKYKNVNERNCEFYASSMWMKAHWSYEKLQAYFINMMDSSKKYFCCGLPYQLSIKEGLLSREQVQDEMSETDFDEDTWTMEMECLPLGSSTDAFFNFEDLQKTRKIKKGFLPLSIYRNHSIAIPDIEPGEERILSCDIALMASGKNRNDAAALTIQRAIPIGDCEYTDNIVYQETYEGLTTDDLGLIIMRLFYQMKCTQLVIDTNGVGMGIYDYCVVNRYDPEYNTTYPAMSCCNDNSMAIRCKVKNAPKVIWSIKANKDFNSTMASSLRASIRSGKVSMLTSEYEAEETIRNIRGFTKMTSNEQALIKKTYVQISLCINELINLDSEISGNVVKLKEKPGMRKDRYSSILYGYYVIQQLSLLLKPKVESTQSLVDKFSKRIRVGVI
jgi:hypothetical protein